MLGWVQACSRLPCGLPHAGVPVVAQARARPYARRHRAAGRAPRVVRHQVGAEQPEVRAVGGLPAGVQVSALGSPAGVGVGGEWVSSVLECK